MLTHLAIRNFKRFGSVEIELGSPVVFIGPNNSGKTSAMQALALWDIGLRRWNEKRLGHTTPKKRPGVTVNRRDLVAIPVPHANLLWRGLSVRNVRKVDGKQTTSNIRIDVTVSGVGEDGAWDCGLEFDYANEESFYCRPLRLSEDRNPERMRVPKAAGKVQIAFLPPMSGLAATESRLDQGAVNVRVGEGRTAEVLRNLCHSVHKEATRWSDLVKRIRDLFGAELRPPRYIAERGEIAMSYRENGIELDLSSAGRGLQQTLPDRRCQPFRSASQRGRGAGSGHRVRGRASPVGQPWQPGVEGPQGVRVRALLSGRANRLGLVPGGVDRSVDPA